MRHILTDYARSRLQVKRGGEAQRVPFDENLGVPVRDPDAELIALDDALHALAAFDERKSQIVQLRFFGGFSVQETAEALKLSERTVEREWTWPKLGCCVNWREGKVMESERWHQIEELYLAALEHEESERHLFVAEACGQDDVLRSEVESLLAYASASPSPRALSNRRPWRSPRSRWQRIGPEETISANWISAPSARTAPVTASWKNWIRAAWAWSTKRKIRS